MRRHAKDNLTRTIDALNNEATMTYDAFGGLLSVTFNAHTTNFLRDQVGNMTRITDPLSNQRNFENVMGWSTARIDALNRRTEYQHNDLGLVTLITYPDLTTVTREYDGEGNLTRVNHLLGSSSIFATLR